MNGAPGVPHVAIINRGSITLEPGDPFQAPLPGTEVVALNLARALAARGVSVSYHGAAHPDTRIPGVVLSTTSQVREFADHSGLRLLWIRDYVLPDWVFDRFRQARHVLLSSDSVNDLTAIMRTPAAAIGERLGGYLRRFDRVVFESRWHLDDWRAGLGIQPANAIIVHNLASHVPWREDPPSFLSRRIVHTCHPRKALAVVAAIADRLQKHGFTVECFGHPSLYQAESCRVVRPTANGLLDLGPFAEFAASHPSLTFRPPVPVDAVADTLDEFGIFLHPDYSGETGATALIEALRRGLVPVVSDLGALPELVARAGVVVPGPSWAEGFADRCAAEIVGLSDSALTQMRRTRSELRHGLDTDPLLRAWCDILALPDDNNTIEERSC